MPFMFQCGGCDPPRTMSDEVLTKRRRPNCYRCGTPFCADVSTMEGEFKDVTITPALAAGYLEHCYELAESEVDPASVSKYATLLSRNQWQHLDLSDGGAHCPITIKDGKVLLGVTRLMAVVESQVPMRAVLCTIGDDNA